MKGLGSSTELLLLRKDGEWYRAQLAISGVPCVPFDIHAGQFEALPTEEAAASFLERQARNLIERYGDGRSPHPEEIVLAREAATFAEMRA